MRDQFYLHFEKMPSGTAQQKGVRIINGKPCFYKKPSVEGAEQMFKAALLPHRPPKPSKRPIRLTIWFAFDVKDKKLWGKPKPTAPDTDNYLKLFKDCMAEVGFFRSDAQVVDEHIIKTYAEKATIGVKWEEVFDNDG